MSASPPTRRGSGRGLGGRVVDPTTPPGRYRPISPAALVVLFSSLGFFGPRQDRQHQKSYTACAMMGIQRLSNCQKRKPK